MSGLIARQSTARIVTVGPVMDADGAFVTTLDEDDFEISKNGGAYVALNGSATATYDAAGRYLVALTTSDLDTVGSAEIGVVDGTNACPVKVVTVIEEAIYDALFAASANVFSGAAGSNAVRLIAANGVAVGSLADNAIAAAKIASNAITAAKIATDAITADKIAANAIGASEVAADAVTKIQSGLSTLDAAGVRTAVGLASANLDTQLGAIAGYIDTEVGEIVSALSTAQADLDIITGADGVTLATAQGNYAPAKAGDEMDLVDAPNATAVGVIQDGLATEAKQDTITGNDGVLLDSATTDVYHAEIDVRVDEANEQDEYSLFWFKNGVRVTSGITSPTLQVVNRSDGTDLIASTTPTEIGSTGIYKHDEGTNRLTAGEAAIVIVGASIDGAARSYAAIVGRDSTA